MREPIKKKLKLLAKLLITALAIWLILRKVDLNAIGNTILKANPIYLLLSLLFFFISKIFAANRLKLFFQDIDVHISSLFNFRLYLIGMFHNLYLPGGVGGDGYKIYLLNKQSKKSVKRLISAVLFDRISGLITLFFLAIMLSFLSSISLIFREYKIIIWIVFILSYPIYLLVSKWFFPNYHKSLFKTTSLSFLTQGIQLICTFFILKSLGVDGKIMEYQALFMLASILTIVPITFGGIGIREMVFIASYQLLELDKDIGVSFSLLFFVITALVSFLGAFLSDKLKIEENIDVEPINNKSKSN